jgi:hypothetical protein
MFKKVIRHNRMQTSTMYGNKFSVKLTIFCLIRDRHSDFGHNKLASLREVHSVLKK